jgi:trehalose 6-phosphate synthase
MAADHHLLVLSNRGPLSIERTPDGLLASRRGGGGLVVTLGPGVERDQALWVAAGVGPDDEAAARRGLFDTGGFRVQPVMIDAADYRAYYDVIANQTLWFCLHDLWDLPRRPRFDRHWWSAWERFRAVNAQFAAAAAEAAAPGATVLVHDYQLALVPEMLAARRPDVRTAAFVHTPWCSPGELATLPDVVASELLAGLAGGGACGFHSARWAEAFEACCRERLGRTPVTFVSPAATDIDDLRLVAASPECEQALTQLNADIGDRRLIVRVDRIELSKNVLRGFWAFDELLESRPDLRGQVVFAAMVYPSRLGLAEYLAYGQEVIALAEQINSKWSVPGWKPILLDPQDNHPKSVAALRRSDVLLVNPIRDGLNLVAKEGPLVNERDGVLILSHQAGAWDELGGQAIGVNPFDVTGTARALADALDLTAAERTTRAQSLRKMAGARSPLDWFDDQRAAAGRP